MYGAAWKLGARMPASRPVQRAIFTRIHETNEWGDPESRSGPGSTVQRGASLRPALLDLLNRHAVSTLLDAPCGFPEPIETIDDIPTTGIAPDKRLGLWELASI